MKKSKYKTIGILGGMGPSASANLYKLIIDLAQSEYGAVQDDDFPPMVIYSVPLIGFGENADVEQPHIKEQLIHGVQLLEKAGAEYIIIACNTVHYHYEAMQASVQVPILNIIHETAAVVNEPTVGIVCSEGTNHLNLYGKELKKNGIDYLSPNEDQQNSLNNIILNVMGGKQGEGDIKSFNKIFKEYEENGAKAVILGCTELPLAITQEQANIKLYNTLEIIALAALAKAGLE